MAISFRKLTDISDFNDSHLIGGIGNDKLEGERDNDQLFGDTGNDLLQGGPGNDLLDGGAGNDELLGGDGDDDFIGGAGKDTASYRESNAGVDISLDGQANETARPAIAYALPAGISAGSARAC